MTIYDAPRTNTKYTVELRELVENGVDLWDFDYPSYYEGEAKKAFERKVIDHYYFRQIGQETPARFLHYFRTRIREIMPYYIQLYKSTAFLDFSDPDIMKSYDLVETFTEKRTDTGTSSTTSEGSLTDSKTNNLNGTKKFSSTPQGSISNIETYMTEATVDNVTNTDNGTSTSTGTVTNDTTGGSDVTHELRRVGNIGVQPLGDELTKNRQAILNVDLQIINELNDLFLGLY